MIIIQINVITANYIWKLIFLWEVFPEWIILKKAVAFFIVFIFWILRIFLSAQIIRKIYKNNSSFWVYKIYLNVQENKRNALMKAYSILNSLLKFFYIVLFRWNINVFCRVHIISFNLSVELLIYLSLENIIVSIVGFYIRI